MTLVVDVRGRSLMRCGLLFLCLVSPALAASPEKSRGTDTLEDEWYTVTMQGSRCGYMHSTATRVGDEVHTQSIMHIEIARGNAHIKIAADQNYRESYDGRPLAFRHVMTLGTIPVTQTGSIENGKLTLVSEQAGAKRVQELDFDPDVKFAWGQLLEQRKRKLTPGTKFKIKTYEPSMKTDGPVELEFQVHEKTVRKVNGKDMELARITSTMQYQVPIVTEMWVEEDASPVIIKTDMGIMKIEMRRTTEKEALADAEAPEMFIETFVRVPQRIDSSAARLRLRLKLPADSAFTLPTIPETSMQSVKRINDREAILTIARLDWKALRAAKDATPLPAMRPYLQASTMVDIDNSRIRKLSRRAVRGADTPAEKADALRKFVTDYVTDKSLDIGFATASEVATTREGDCTEHGVLLAALARAAGLPARGVGGLIQVPRGPLSPAKGTAFGYHMWTQVFFGGKWVDIDAAMRETDCNPTHIALSLMPLNDEGVLDSVMSLLPMMGKLQIEVLPEK